MLFKNYKNCIYCNSQNFEKKTNQSNESNFYLDAIVDDLNISKKDLKKIKTYECKNCFILQNNPWFSEKIAKKIFSNIYGQHNRSWSNLINFLKKSKAPDHGELFNLLNKLLKVKNYAEFNSPFMGIFLNYFAQEYQLNKKFYSNIYTHTINYLSSRQVAGKNKNLQKKGSIKSKKSLNRIKFFKNKFKKKKRINKYLFIDNSSLAWGQNDNHKSVNSKSFANEMLDLEILQLHEKNKVKLDLFGIFHTLDHTMQPSLILNFALDVSKYVVVYCHVNEQVERQHLFSLTNNFLKYLNKKKIFTFNVTKIINKKFKTPELYFICTKKKNYKDRLKKIISNEKKFNQ